MTFVPFDPATLETLTATNRFAHDIVTAFVKKLNLALLLNIELNVCTAVL